MHSSSDPLKSFTWFALMILLLITAGCLPEPVTPQSGTPSATLPSPELTPTPTAAPSPSLVPTYTPRTFPTRLPTATPIPTPPITQRCLQFQTSSPPAQYGRLVLSGFRISASYPGLIEGESYLMDLQSGEWISLGHTRFETVSPDGKWLAYYDIEQEQVAVVDYDGRLIYETPAPQQQLEPVYWLDNQRLVLNQNIPVTPGPGGPNWDLVILNPFTNERQEWHPDFPNQREVNPYWQLGSNLVFNAALTHLIYPVYEEDFPIVLWNVQSEQVIRKIYRGSYSSMPHWSPDGRYIVTDAPLRSADYRSHINFEDGLPYQGGTELFLVNLDGDIQRLTYFTVLQPRMQHDYIWARDGQGIAFYSRSLNSITPDLAYIDLDTSITIDYCATRELPLNQSLIPIFPPDIVWSPEGDYLAVTFLDNEFRYTVNLVELSTGYAWQIGEDLSVMGWMVSP